MNIYTIVSGAVLIIVPVGIIILEGFLSFNKTKGDTFTGIIHDWAYGKNFFITLAWGIVTGHLFLGSVKPVIKDNTMSVLVIAFLAVTAALIGCSMKRQKTNWLFQFLILIVGVIIGHLVWSMNDFS